MPYVVSDQNTRLHALQVLPQCHLLCFCDIITLYVIASRPPSLTRKIWGLNSVLVNAHPEVASFGLWQTFSPPVGPRRSPATPVGARRLRPCKELILPPPDGHLLFAIKRGGTLGHESSYPFAAIGAARHFSNRAGFLFPFGIPGFRWLRIGSNVWPHRRTGLVLLPTDAQFQGRSSEPDRREPPD